MTVFILERVPPSLRGELSRWMVEPKAGVFIGRLSATVREELWGKAVKGRKGGSVVAMFRADTAQGYDMWVYGEPARLPVDFDGLTLVRRPR